MRQHKLGSIIESPHQIKEHCHISWKSYMDGLYERWLANKHPTVNNEGHPISLELSKDDRFNMMRKLVGTTADLLPPDSWHNHSTSPRSSQALVVAILGNLLKYDALGIFESLLEIETRNIAGVRFETKKGRTHFDAIMNSSEGGIVATIEAKFTEEGFGTCRYPLNRCSGFWHEKPGIPFGCPMALPTRNKNTASRYWAIAQELGFMKDPPAKAMICPLWAGYQAVHNLAETRYLFANCRWILLYDERNPYFSGNDKFQGWISVLEKLGTLNWSPISWQRLLRACPKEVLSELKVLIRLHGFLSERELQERL